MQETGGPVVCFDLDGTLLDPNGSIRQTIDVVVTEAGFDPFSREEVLIGMPLRDILRLRTADAAVIEAMVQRYRTVFQEQSWRMVRYVPGVRDVVEAVRAAGAQTAIVTTKGEEEAERLLSDLGDLWMWDTVVGDDDVRPLKPSPEPVIAACGRLGRHPRDAVMIGDTIYDVAAGKAAGAYTIGVMWGHGHAQDLAAADAVVDDAAALREAVLAWLGQKKVA